jgi:predicted RNA-binding protein with PUA-like domain
MKSEPSTYSIDDLLRDGSTPWEGVRNYQARNYMRDEMKVGDLVLFYHSNAEPPGVAGLARVSREAYADRTAFNSNSEYFDAASTPENPRWVHVDVAFVEKWPQVVSLAELKNDEALAGMEVLRKGSRLSVQRVSDAHFERVVTLGRGVGR